MAVKTITIDLEAYGLLARQKRDGQSFSDVIKAHFGRTPTAAGFRALLRDIRLSGETIDGIERQVLARRAERARAARR
jgi:predicted CopG family antitoxin